MKITWFGHSAFRIDFDDAVLMIDPFLSGNPTFEGEAMEAAKGVTHIALTHGHDDHIGDTVEICKETNATLIAVFELALHLNAKGVENFEPAGTGGTIDCGAFTITLVKADHSSSSEGVYLGNAGGLIICCKKSGKTVYHMGDTDIFSDMALIEERYKPEIGITPIGDRFTMGPETAALSCQKYFSFEKILPCHYNTFPLLPGKIDDFKKALGDDADKLSVLGVGEGIEI